MAMNHRLLRPTASGIHPEAMDWRTRVISNGGTVDGQTMSAVSAFCHRIDGSGLRDKFYRLNLFCGDGLAAALVPLYRAESQTASARGNATDINNNFVSGDFNNTGASAGLVGNGTNKYLNTGLGANVTAAANLHVSCDVLAANTLTSYRNLMGAARGSPNRAVGLSARASIGDTNARAVLFGGYGPYVGTFGPQIYSADVGTGHLVAAWPTFYRNGTAEGDTATTSVDYPDDHAIGVFANISAGISASEYSNPRISSYSIGQTMTQSQVVSFVNAMSVFRSALSRT